MAEQNNEEIIRATVNKLSTDPNLDYLCPCVRGKGRFPSQQAVKEIINLCRSLIFPGYFDNATYSMDNLSTHIGVDVGRLRLLLAKEIAGGFVVAEEPHDGLRERSLELADRFIESLPTIRLMMNEDVEAIYRGDPAAVSPGEVICCYPAVRAIGNYRIANRLHRLGVPVVPRMIAEAAHRETGIDIHPAATIGHSFMIDHGTGVVVGETAIIGDNVKIYQGVTLGAKSFPTDENDNAVKGLPRHPIIGDDVVIYANSTILGRVTIGSGSTIGGNIWVTDDVAPGSIIVQARANNQVRQKR